MAFSTEFKIGVGLSIVIAVLAAGSAPWWWKYGPWESTTAVAGGPVDVQQISGGCPAFQLFAQGRWKPYGSTVRSQPNVESRVVTTSPENLSLAVDGWVHSRAAYPTNTAPFNSDAWYHLADSSGWVAFGGVRAVPTSEDPTGLADGGPPAPRAKSCQGAVR